MSSDVTVIIPVLNRPHRIMPVVSSIVHSSDAEIILVPSFENFSEELEEAIAEALEFTDRVTSRPYRDLHPSVGNYAKKINFAMKEWVDTEWLFTGADDLYFHDGWFTQCMDTARQHPQARVIGTNDLGHPRVYAMHETSTHSLVRFDYAWEQGTIDEPGKVLHEGYVHEFVDDELVGTAKYRGVWAFSMLAHVEHMHPVWGKAPTDATYDDQGRRMNESRMLYRSRCPLWNGIPI